MPTRPSTLDSDRDVDTVERSERGERTGSRWTAAGTVCAAVLAATLVACLVIVVAGRQHHRHRIDAPVTPSGPATPTRPTEPTAGRATGTTANDSAPGPVPSDVSWRQVGLGALPFSPSAGPATVTAGVPHGFAHDRAGALLAACQILGRLSWSAVSVTQMHAVATTMTAPEAQALEAIGAGPPTDPSLIPQLAGFQFVTEAPDAVVVSLALRFHATLRAAPVALTWAGGDWRLAGAPGPLTQTSWAALDDLTGYVLFSGQPTVTGH